MKEESSFFFFGSR